MPCSSFHALTLGILLFSSFAAQAQQTTYVYTGSEFTDIQTAQDGGIVYGHIVTGQVVLAQPLPSDGIFVVTPVSYEFTGDLQLQFPTPINSINSVGSPTFSFTTVKGAITAWSIVAYSSYGEGLTTATLNVSSQGDIYEYQHFRGDCMHVMDDCFYYSASNTTPGTWSVPQAEYAVSQGTLAWWTARAWQLSAQYNGEVADVAYLNMIDHQVQTQRDANWNRRGQLTAIANQVQTQRDAALALVATCRANAGKC